MLLESLVKPTTPSRPHTSLYPACGAGKLQGVTHCLHSLWETLVDAATSKWQSLLIKTVFERFSVYMKGPEKLQGVVKFCPSFEAR